VLDKRAEMAAALLWTHEHSAVGLHLPPVAEALAGIAAGFGIGVVAAVMGVAGGELLIPTITLLYAVDVRPPAACVWSCRCPRCWSPSPGTAATRPSASYAAQLRIEGVQEPPGTGPVAG